jgi:F0F1-type ATP synthase membrane subunit b/b'
MLFYFKSIFFTFLFCSFSLYSNSHHINWWSIGSNYKDNPAIGWQLFTFSIFILFIVVTSKKPINLFLRQRSEEIEKQINDANTMMINAQNHNNVLKDKQKSLNGCIEKIKKDFKLKSENLKKEINNSTELIVTSIRENTKKGMDAEVLNAKKELKSKIIDISIFQAKKYLKKNISRGDDINLQKRFVEKFLQGRDNL